MAPLLNGLCGALDRPHGCRMGAAAADQRRECRFDLLVSGTRIAIVQLDGRHDPPVDTVRALVDLLFDPGFLDWVRLLRGADAGKRGDFLSFNRPHRSDARAHGAAVNMDRAGAALTEPAAEAGIDQAKLVAQGIEERHGRVVDLDRPRLTVD